MQVEARVRAGSMIWLLEDGCKLNRLSLKANEAFPVAVGDVKVLVDTRELVGHITIGAE
jgi:hypothetical protein